MYGEEVADAWGGGIGCVGRTYWMSEEEVVNIRGSSRCMGRSKRMCGEEAADVWGGGSGCMWRR